MSVAALPQTLEFRHLPDGSVIAALHVHMPDGSTRTFEASAHEDEISGDDEIGSLWSGLKKLGRSIGHVARSIAHSKVFKIAAIALASAVPFAGPVLGPALLATAAATGIASKLAHSHLLHKAGHAAAAAKVALSASADAHKITGGNKDAARALLTAANKKRLAADALASKGPPSAQKPAQPARSATRDPLVAARAGRLLSSEGRPVSEEELRAAHASGRVFWLA